MPSPFHPRPTSLYLLSSPLASLLHPIHLLLSRLRGPPRHTHTPPNHRPIRIVCISDTHTYQWSDRDIPDGDLLIHAGDLTNDGSLREIQAAVNWIKTLPHSEKVVICGNHDSFFDPKSRREEDRVEGSGVGAGVGVDWGGVHYLQNSAVTLSFPTTTVTHSEEKETEKEKETETEKERTLSIYGAPQIPSIIPFSSEHAFTYPPTDAEAEAIWSNTIPPQTQILVTHTPPQSHLDLSPIYSTGCPHLLSELWRVRPSLHVFGHIHAAYGAEPVFFDEAQKAWERICEKRRSRSTAVSESESVSVSGLAWVWALLVGVVRDLADLEGLVDAGRVVGWGVWGVVRRVVWGSGVNRGAWMVNAAGLDVKTKRLGNKPQVVVL